MSKPKRQKVEVNHIVWERGDENQVLSILNDSLKGHEDSDHKCLFFDFNELMAIPKNISVAYAFSLFKLDHTNEYIAEQRRKKHVLAEIEKLTLMKQMVPLTNRLIKFENILEGVPLNNFKEAMLNKFLVMYFIAGPLNEDLVVREKPDSSDYSTTWNAPSLIRDEITNSEYLIQKGQRYFDNQLQQLINAQKQEYHLFEKKMEDSKIKNNTKEMSDFLMELRDFHNKELEDIKIFHDFFIKYTKRYVKKLSLVASEVPILDSITKIVSCHRCGHLLSLITDTPTKLPNSYITSKGNIINLYESTRDISDQTFKTADDDDDTAVFGGTKYKRPDRRTTHEKLPDFKSKLSSQDTLSYYRKPLKERKGDGNFMYSKNNELLAGQQQSEKGSSQNENMNRTFSHNSSHAKLPQNANNTPNEGSPPNQKIKKSTSFHHKTDPDDAEDRIMRPASKSPLKSGMKPNPRYTTDSSADEDEGVSRNSSKKKIRFEDDLFNNNNQPYIPKHAPFGSNYRSDDERQPKVFSVHEKKYKPELPPIMKGVETEAKWVMDYKQQKRQNKGSKQSYLNFLSDNASIYADSKYNSSKMDSSETNHDQPPKQKSYFKSKSQIQNPHFHNHSNINSNLGNNIPSTSNDGDMEDTLYGQAGRDAPTKPRKFKSSLKKKYEHILGNTDAPTPPPKEKPVIKAKKEDGQWIFVDINRDQSPNNNDPIRDFIKEAKQQEKKAKFIESEKSPQQTKQKSTIHRQASATLEEEEHKNLGGNTTPQPPQEKKYYGWQKRPVQNVESSFYQSNIQRIRNKLEGGPPQPKPQQNAFQRLISMKNQGAKENIEKPYDFFKQLREAYQQNDDNKARATSTIRNQGNRGGQSQQQQQQQQGARSGSVHMRDSSEADHNKYRSIIRAHMKKMNDDQTSMEETLLKKDPEKENLIARITQQKPWLSKKFLYNYKIHALKANFPIQEYPRIMTDGEVNELDREVRFINSTVEPLRDKPRELKTDIELANDVRYYNKYGDFLINRIQKKTYYERLGLTVYATEADIKSAYRAMALQWHPDNTKKSFKFCFANENAYQRVVSEVFYLIDEAYRTISNFERRKFYDKGLGIQ